MDQTTTFPDMVFESRTSALPFTIAALPVVTFGIYIFLQSFPSTRAFATWLVQENRPVELLTFLSLLAAGVVALRLANRLRKREPYLLAAIALALFGAGCLVVAMEEISWGQQFFGFATPESIKHINRQGEVTLHNLGGVQGHASYLYLCFGLGGLAGYLLHRFDFGSRSLRALAPPAVLASYFVTIVLFAIVKLYVDAENVSKTLRLAVRWTSEVDEMIVGFAAFLYASMKWNSLAFLQPQRTDHSLAGC